jgi:hypothetical protein
VLARDEFILHRLGLGFRLRHDFLHRGRKIDLCRLAVCLGQLLHELRVAVFEAGAIYPQPLEERRHDAAFLFHKRGQKVFRLYRAVIVFLRNGSGVPQRFLRL